MSRRPYAKCASTRTECTADQGGRQAALVQRRMEYDGNSGAQLILDGPPQFINVALHESFPTKSIETIKEQRRRQDYKTAVKSFIDELSRAPLSSSSDEEDEQPLHCQDRTNHHHQPLQQFNTRDPQTRTNFLPSSPMKRRREKRRVYAEV